MTNENRFVFVCPIYNASSTLDQCLVSLVGQSYKNWRVILVDDVSDKHEVIVEAEIINRWRNIVDPCFASLSENQQKISIIWNDEKKWEVANVLKGISMCDDDDIVCRIDGDDFLTDLDALRIINEVYNKYCCDCLWTAHRWFDNDVITSQNISDVLPEGVDPYVYRWVSSHLKTFRKHLLNGINDQNFRGKDGEYFKRIGDQAVMLPVLHNSKKHIYLPLVTYAYRCEMKPATFQTDDAKFQRDEALFLRSRGFVP